ncbi:MAG: hypothetical protein ACK4UO_00920 [Pseudolabrys sp.]
MVRPAAVLAVVLLIASPAAAQGTPPRAGQDEPGFFGSIGRWFDEQAANIGATFGDARRKVETFGRDAGVAARSTAEGAKDAADAVARLPNTRVVSGHEKCRTAPNGAPDCIVAANAICKARGFDSGKSLDMTTAEECPAKVWTSGRKNEGDCKTITFVSRALCQ